MKISKLHKCMLADGDFYFKNTPFKALFAFWKDGAYAAYLPLSIANEMIGVEFNNVLGVDGTLYVSTKELKKFNVVNPTVDKVNSYLRGIKKVCQKAYHVHAA